jgi:dihydroorotate dehydrogenase
MEKYDLVFSNPLLNSAGTLGFFPDPNKLNDVRTLGAFVTNPVSAHPRTPAVVTRFIPYEGGFLLHTGNPNPGFRTVFRRYRRLWGKSSIPIILHLLAENPGELAGMVQRVEGIEGVAGIELGLPPDIDGDSADALVQSAIGELPIIVRLPLDRALELAPLLSMKSDLIFSLGPPRGALPDHHGRFVHGRLYGPAVLPQSIRVVKALTGQGCTVIGSGGVYRSEDLRALLSAGALAVMLDAVLWRDGSLPDWGGYLTLP